jgi:hypothetical protein
MTSKMTVDTEEWVTDQRGDKKEAGNSHKGKCELCGTLNRQENFPSSMGTAHDMCQSDQTVFCALHGLDWDHELRKSERC